MKKIFTLVAAAFVVAGAYAQTGVIKVDKTMVIYTTNDTITSEMGEEEDPDTGDMIEKVVPKYWMGSSMVDAFNTCGLPLTGTSTTQTQYKITTRQDYTDPETGFNMPAGSYRGVFVDGEIGFTGALGSDKVNGYSNVKSVVLYFIPIPTAWKADGSVSHQDYPTGRVHARYVTVDDAGTVTNASNRAYREIHIDEVADPNAGDAQNIKSVNLAGFTRAADNPLDITIDRPIKLVTNLQNIPDGTSYESIFEDATTKQSEFKNVVCENGKNDYEFSLYFAKHQYCEPYYASDGNDHGTHGAHPGNPDSATGYCCTCGKWGEKIDWTPETIMQFSVKKRMYLVGMAIVSATDGAASQFMNAANKLNASWKDSDKAYTASYATAGDATAIQTVNASTAKVAPRKQLVNGQIVIGNYNIAGQRVK